VDDLKPGNAVPGKSIPIKLGLFGPVYDLPFIRCECGGDAAPLDSSWDAQRDTIEYVCPDCGARWTERVH
jgi:hypothetical protein